MIFRYRLLLQNPRSTIYGFVTTRYLQASGTYLNLSCSSLFKRLKRIVRMLPSWIIRFSLTAVIGWDCSSMFDGVTVEVSRYRRPSYIIFDGRCRKSLHDRFAGRRQTATTIPSHPFNILESFPICLPSLHPNKSGWPKRLRNRLPNRRDPLMPRQQLHHRDRSLGEAHGALHWALH